MLLVLVAVTIISFYPSLSCGFTNWDDDKYVTDNLLIRNLTWHNVKTMFTTFQNQWYYPVVSLSFAVEYYFFGLNPRIYHVTNLVLHVLNVLCVYWFIFLLIRNHLVSFIAALLFTVHPLRVESVVWITERKDLLFSLFFLLSSIAYIYYSQKGKIVYYILSLLLFIISLFSKQMAATLPFTLLLIDFFIGRLNWKALINKIPYIIASAAMVFIILFHNKYLSQSTAQFAELSWYHYFFVASYVLLFHLYKILLPVHLCAIYPFPDEMYKGILPIWFWISPAVVIALAVMTYYVYRVSKMAAFGLIFFVLNIFPVLQLIPIITFEIAADRFTYIPFIGLALVFALSFNWLCLSWAPMARRPLRYGAAALFAILMVILSTMTSLRCGVWRDSLTLWNDVQRQYPDLWVSYTNRGIMYGEMGQYDNAFRDLNRAIELFPTATPSYINRSLVFRRTNNPDRAIEDLNTALAIEPRNPTILLHRGICFAMKKSYDRALADFSAVLAIDPSIEEARLNRDRALEEKMTMNRTIADLKEKAEREPNRADIRVDRGALLYQRGDLEGAMKEYSEAIRLNPSFAVAYYNRALVYKAVGEYDKAISDYTNTYRAAPDFPDILKGRGSVYAQKGDFPRAIEDFSLCLKKNDRDLEACMNRGTAYAQMGLYDKGIEDFTRVLELNARYTEAYYRRAALYRLKRDHDKADMDIERIKEVDNAFNRKKLDDFVTLFAG